MLELNIQSKIKTELTAILQEAIQSEKIDTETLRMIILSINDGLDTLEVYAQNDWNIHRLDEDAPMIGEINISEWVAVVHEVLKTDKAIDPVYIERATEIEKKYTEKEPAITFEDFEISTDAQRAALICLREEMLTQLNASIVQVANSVSDNTIKHAVGILTNHITYEYDDIEYEEDGLLLHGFLHQQTEGPFYNVSIMHGNKVLSNHFLCFTEKGIQLFCKKNSYQLNDVSVCSYEAKDFTFMYADDEDLFIRINGDTKTLFITAIEDDLQTTKNTSEKNFLKDVNLFLKAFAEKVLDKDTVPNPITNKDAFDKWLHFLLEQKVYMGNHDTVFDYGDDAYNYYLQSLPTDSLQSQRALSFHASKLFRVGRFEESVTAFKKMLKLENSDKLEYLCALLLDNKKEDYDAYRSSIEVDYSQEVLQLLDILWILKEPLDEDTLKALEQKIKTIPIPTYSIKGLRTVVLIKLYTLLQDHDNALLQTQRLFIDHTLEWFLLRYELPQTDCVSQSYEKLVQQEAKENAFREQEIPAAFNTSKNKQTPIDYTTYNDCYYLTDRIEIQDCQWVHPIDANTFLAVIEEDEVLLVRASITADKTVEILHQTILPKTHNVASCTYLDGVIYIADQSRGIVSYTVTANAFELRSAVYKNKNNAAYYRNLCIADGYLYASNNCFLEIFDLKKPEVPALKDSLYIHFGGQLFVHHNLLVVCSTHGYVMLIDISDKTNPVWLCTLEEDETPRNMHIEFVGDYLICRSIYNIKAPTAPICIGTIKENVVPIYYFAPKPEVLLLSTGDDYLFTTLQLEDKHARYTNWLPSKESEHNTNIGARDNLATAYFDSTVISYGRYEIQFWKKELNRIIN
ncbi:hypothetical protein [uncultured Cytophaga sp.]|uniref:hypothetical protein n=1 Tax=uncultured Cytophaga sp. TaxID=160238 RepID=UPI0026218BC0|nr:hypothetical protein [uncultured Cytophaga sp.]